MLVLGNSYFNQAHWNRLISLDNLWFYALTNWLTVIDEKQWPESPYTSQNCKKVETDPQCLLKYIRDALKYPVVSGRKEKSNYHLG